MVNIHMRRYFNIIICQGNENQTTMNYNFIPDRRRQSSKIYEIAGIANM